MQATYERLSTTSKPDIMNRNLESWENPSGCTVHIHWNLNSGFKHARSKPDNNMYGDLTIFGNFRCGTSVTISAGVDRVADGLLRL